MVRTGIVSDRVAPLFSWLGPCIFTFAIMHIFKEHRFFYQSSFNNIKNAVVFVLNTFSDNVEFPVFPACIHWIWKEYTNRALEMIRFRFSLFGLWRGRDTKTTSKEPKSKITFAGDTCIPKEGYGTVHIKEYLNITSSLKIISTVHFCH